MTGKETREEKTEGREKSSAMCVCVCECTCMCVATLNTRVDAPRVCPAQHDQRAS